VAGDVLIIGGATTNGKNTSLEFFDPNTKKLTNAGFKGGGSALSAVPRVRASRIDHRA